MKEILTATHNYSSSDIKNVCTEAAFGPLRQLDGRQLLQVSSQEVSAITMEHFRAALQAVRPATQLDQLSEYERWNRQFGSVLASPLDSSNLTHDLCQPAPSPSTCLSNANIKT
eukprot:TRINITY_DN3679_c0_g1_i2.p1 TRINITY_DN3679_c0_g1~~TRINITY_DN3679_c0_g1_i2.p1  ORF type:complete len:114 (+),score=15.91 TRINITY_DN3679_c0_g1_i2:66-407(+)